MTMKQIANRTVTPWKLVVLVLGLGVTGSIAAVVSFDRMCRFGRFNCKVICATWMLKH